MGLAILSEPDEDEEAYDHEHLPRRLLPRDTSARIRP
jgi:hypothetical protein